MGSINQSPWIHIYKHFLINQLRPSLPSVDNFYHQILRDLEIREKRYRDFRPPKRSKTYSKEFECLSNLYYYHK